MESLNKNEEQIWLYVTSYEGITQKELEEKHLACNLRVRDTLYALMRKGLVDGTEPPIVEWYPRTS
jgi:hypothetical protein